MTDIIPPETLDEAPSSKLAITYSSGKVVEFGQELSPIDVKDEPHVSWEADPSVYYTLIMIDPDAPSRQEPQFAEVKHWLVVNILGNDVSTGEVIAEHIGSAPPKGSGLHRYIFLVFEQKGKMEFDEPKSSKNSVVNRPKWSMRGFMKKYDLKAFAGNYYAAQWDPYVDELRKRFLNN